jgi:hypothetical protein
VYVSVFVSSAVFLLGEPPLIAVRFGPNEQLVSRDFRLAMMEENAAVGKAKKKEKVWDKTRGDQAERGRRGREGGRSQEDKLSPSSCEHGRRGSHGLQVPRLSDPPARDNVVVHEKAQNSARKRAHLGSSNEGEHARETREHSPVAHPRPPCLTRSPARAAGGGRAPR